jgi:RHS repeat-associated protein
MDSSLLVADQYNYFRTYDPSSGRYLEADPLGLDGGPHLYAYVESVPTGYVDPQGLFASTVDAYCTRHPLMCGAAFGVATSTGVQYAATGRIDPKLVLRDAALGGLLGKAAPMLAQFVGRLRNLRQAATAASREGTTWIQILWLGSSAGTSRNVMVTGSTKTVSKSILSTILVGQ